MQASKGVTLLALEDVSRSFSTSGRPTRGQEVLNAPRRIYVAFGEHSARGVCVCVCSSKLVVLLLGCLFVCAICSFVCLFGCLLIRVSLYFFGWLAVCVYVCLLVVWHVAAYFRALLALWGTVLRLSCTFGDLGTPS